MERGMDAIDLLSWMTLLGLVLFGVVFVRVFNTLPNLSNLFRHSPESAPDATRLQAFVFSLISLIGYALSTLAWHPSLHTPPIMPDVPSELLAAIGGSHGVYLVKKYLHVQKSRRELP